MSTPRPLISCDSPAGSRAQHILSAVERRYPTAWTHAEDFRRQRNQDLLHWADWCYVPLLAAYRTVSNDATELIHPTRSHHCAIVAALSTWRVTQGLYKFDGGLYGDLIHADTEFQIEEHSYYHLPQWSVYVQTPGLQWHERRLHGFWAHLTEDLITESQQLCLLLDTASDVHDPFDYFSGCLPISVSLDALPLEEAISTAQLINSARLIRSGYIGHSHFQENTSPSALRSVLALLNYLCTNYAAISGHNGTPRNPVTAPSHATPIATRPETWEVRSADGLGNNN